MPKRTKLSARILPDYSNGEEIMNMVTHIVGGGIGILVLFLCVGKAFRNGTALDIIGASVYGLSMVSVFTISSVYHGLHSGTAKKVMQVIDHCMIYFLIAGTYTPIMLTAFVPTYPLIGWGLLAAEWILAGIAATLTAIDLHNYRTFSMFCYIVMGWGIIFFLPQTLAVMGTTGFALLLAGGIAYTIGAILFGVGVKVKWMHSVFHIFVVIGSFLQFLPILLYVL
ncbi:MAG: hemolysin III family protein [Oscillospiraceae bacterium]|nr:hemolysin III family protein [Oscillospiraceae bacterium]